MKLRKLIFWLHLIAGIVAGTVVLIMSVTGVLLVYQKQIIAWADSGFRANPPSAGAERLPVETILSKMRESGGPAVTNLTFSSDPATPISAAAGTGNTAATVFVNPYTGNTMGVPSPGVRTFFRNVTDWHRYLAMSGDSRPAGRSITGASNFAFLFIVCSGFYLWWAHKAFWFRRGLGGKARDWNWHNVFGSWSAIPLFVIVLSGVVMSYPWATNLVYRMAGNEPPAQGQAGGGGSASPGGGRSVLDATGLEPLIAQAVQQSPGWTSMVLRLPNKSDSSVTFNIDKGNGGQPQLKSTLTLDRKTGAVVKSEAFQDQLPGRRARSWFRFAHTGEFYGIIGQTIAGIGTFGAVMLVWTGFALSLRRFRAWLRAREFEIRGQATQSPISEVQEIGD